jgi:hypothetical protein
MKQSKQKFNKITALYCRLSRDDLSETDGFAEGNSMSIQTQKAMLKHYADEHGFSNCQYIKGTVKNTVPFKCAYIICHSTQGA